MSDETHKLAQPHDHRVHHALFWMLLVGLTIYVGWISGNVVFHPQSDFWEHHRAVVRLIDTWSDPGNPTFATEHTSIRYSPYSVMIAGFCRMTGVSSWIAFQFAAAFNTVIVLLGVRTLLATYGLKAATASVVVMMLLLYGSVPGYANSFALADLPWMQVNPSAFAMGLVLFALALFRRSEDASLAMAFAVSFIIAALLGIATLSHAMTGAMGAIVIGLMGVMSPRDVRLRQCAMVGLIGVVTAAICLVWPMYSFLDAARSPSNAGYWFETSYIGPMLTDWMMPAMIGSLIALTLTDDKLFRRDFYVFGIVLVGVGLFAWILRSASLARFPFAGLVFFHALIGVYAYRCHLFHPRLWLERLRAFNEWQIPITASTILQLVLLAVLLRFLVPQMKIITTSPHLMDHYVRPLLGRELRGTNFRESFEKLFLDHVQDRDVVLADKMTSWPMPSISGRVVAAQHYELFVPDQPQRDIDVARFIAVDTTEEERRTILNRYDVKWIVLNAEAQSPDVMRELRRASAIVSEYGAYTLMNAEAWRLSTSE